MAHKDDRAITLVDKGKTSSGWRMVRYRDASGQSFTVRVLSAGTSSGLKLVVGSGPGKQIIDNVPKATTMKQTGVYFSPTSNV